ncbi:MAG: hypothetical protein ACTHJ4_05215 [Candidatus Nucleicultricaceae bacterium]
MSVSFMALCGLILYHPVEASRDINAENVSPSRSNKHPRNHHQIQMVESSNNTNHPYQRTFKSKTISETDLIANGNYVYQQTFAPKMGENSETIQYQMETAAPHVRGHQTPQTTTSTAHPIPITNRKKKSTTASQLDSNRQPLRAIQPPQPSSYQGQSNAAHPQKQSASTEKSLPRNPRITPQYQPAPEDIVVATIAPRNDLVSLPRISGSRPLEVMIPDYQSNESHPLLGKVLQLPLRDPLLIELLEKHPQYSMINILNAYESLTGRTSQNSATLLTLENDHYKAKRSLASLTSLATLATSAPQTVQRIAPQNNIIQGTMALLPLNASRDTIITTIKSALRETYNPDHDSHLSLSYLSLSQKIQELQEKRLISSIEEKMLLIKLENEKAQIELFGSNENYMLAMQHLIQALNNRNYTPTQRYAIFILLSDDQHFGSLTSLNHMVHLQKYRLSLSERVIATLPEIEDAMMCPVHNTVNISGLTQRIRELNDPKIHNSSLSELKTLHPLFMNLTIDDLIAPPYPPQSPSHITYYQVIHSNTLPLQKAAVYEFAATFMLNYLGTTSRSLTLNYNPEIVRRKLEMALFYLDMESSNSNTLPIDDSSLKQKVMQKLIQRINNSALRLKHLYIDTHTR